ncbi:MAG TPA: hypothetical protein VH165_33945 [Kofleriaceae bacterium]|nr:hypothetical protein [Kofleriaceae bacterium]
MGSDVQGGARAARPMWWLGLGCVVALAACSSSKSASAPDAGGPLCVADQPISCTGTTLTTCNADGTAQVTSMCGLGCSANPPHCSDIAPSNNLGLYLDMAAAQPVLSLGGTTTINTDDGSVVVDGAPVAVMHMAVAQTSGPTVQVFVVKAATAGDVTITGGNPFALVSDQEIQITGTVDASASGMSGGPGRFNDPACQGKAGERANLGGNDGSIISGSGGGGFGTPGGSGGDATGMLATAHGGAAGQTSGNAELAPLRGGCDGGAGVVNPNFFGRGGGAIQLVSRTKITITGVLAANGGAGGAGGAGGGILLEAPEVVALGTVVANGAGGADGGLLGTPGQPGGFNTTPAAGAPSCGADCGGGGSGAAGTSPSGPGESKTDASSNVVSSGMGGGGAGRIRINTLMPPVTTGVFSPAPSTGPLATR